MFQCALKHLDLDRTKHRFLEGEKTRASHQSAQSTQLKKDLDSPLQTHRTCRNQIQAERQRKAQGQGPAIDDDLENQSSVTEMQTTHPVQIRFRSPSGIVSQGS